MGQPLKASLRQAAQIWWEVTTAGFWVTFLNRLGRKARKRWIRPVTVLCDLVYAETDGVALNLDLFLPVETSAVSSPAVVVLHGGAWCVGSKRDVAWLGQLLAHRGMVSACVGYRLAPQHRYPAQLHDVQACVRWLRKNAERWKIDPENIAAIGISAGGLLALHLGLRDEEREGISSRVRRVVAIFAPTDLTASYYIAAAEHPLPFTPNYLRDFLGATYHEVPEVWHDASPISHVHADAAPCFLIQGKRDRLVPPDQALRFAEKMRAAGAKVTLVLLDGLGHGYSLRPQVIRQLHNAMDEAFRFLTGDGL